MVCQPIFLPCGKQVVEIGEAAEAGKEVRNFNKDQRLWSFHFAVVKAWKVDAAGNLILRLQRKINPAAGGG